MRSPCCCSIVSITIHIFTVHSQSIRPSISKSLLICATRSPPVRVVSIGLVAVFLFPKLRVPIHQQLDVGNGLFHIVGLSDANDIFRHTPALAGRHVNIDLVVSANVLNLGTSGTNDTVEEFLRDIDLLVDHSRVGNGVVVVGANVLDDLLGLLDICRAVTGNSNADRGFHVSNLCVLECEIVRAEEKRAENE